MTRSESSAPGRWLGRRLMFRLSDTTPARVGFATVAAADPEIRGHEFPGV